MTFTTSLADRKDGGMGRRWGGVLFQRKGGQVRPVTFQFFLRRLTFGATADAGNPLACSLRCPMNCVAVEKVCLTNRVSNRDHLTHIKIREERQLQGGELLVFLKPIIPPTPSGYVPDAEPAFLLLLILFFVVSGMGQSCR